MPNNFNRWNAVQETSKAFQVFKYHQNQLSKFIWSQAMSSAYTYHQLNKTSQANWNDTPSKHFNFDDVRTSHFVDIKDWSNSFNEFENWLNLSALLSVCSYLELFLDSVISLSIQSDPGFLYKMSHKIDGIYVLKYGKYPEDYIKGYVMKCNKGDWNQRFKYYKEIFSCLPDGVEDNIEVLENMRKLRNKVAHSFGRDIKDAHDKTILLTKSSERLQRKMLLKYMNCAFSVAKKIDKQLLNQHIGEYELIYFYHTIQQKNKATNTKEKAHFLKKKLGFTKKANEIGLMPYMSKEFCIELVDYYESI